MSCKRSFLVVANLTAMSDELLTALEARAERAPARFTLIVPATAPAGGRAAARDRLSAVLERVRAAGLEVDGRVAGGDPIEAVSEAWDPRRYDEIIVSTLPMQVSKWLHIGLPQRIAELTGALVTHVVATPSRPPVEVMHVQPRAQGMSGPLAPLRALEAVMTIGERRSQNRVNQRAPRPSRSTR